jgi:hypothetical protein
MVSAIAMVLMHAAGTVDPMLAQTPRFEAFGNRFTSSVEVVGCDMGATVRVVIGDLSLRARWGSAKLGVHLFSQQCEVN